MDPATNKLLAAFAPQAQFEIQPQDRRDQVDLAEFQSALLKHQIPPLTESPVESRGVPYCPLDG